MGGIWGDLSEWLQDFWQAATYHGAAGRIRRGRAPLTSLLLVISSLQVSIPAIGFPATQPAAYYHLLFQLTGVAAPRARYDHKQQCLTYRPMQLPGRQFGDVACRQASFPVHACLLLCISVHVVTSMK